VRTWCLYWGRPRVTALLSDPTGPHVAGLSTMQTLRLFGFVLFFIGAALFLAACRWQRQARERYRRDDTRRPELVPRAAARRGTARPSHPRPWYERPGSGPHATAREYPVVRLPAAAPQVRYDWHRRSNGTRRYDGTHWYDGARWYDARKLAELVHRPEQPDLRHRIRGA
jgi:hypothetical protein